MDLAAASRLAKQNHADAQQATRARGLLREYPPVFDQQSAIGRFTAIEAHPLAHEKMAHMHKQRPFSIT